MWVLRLAGFWGTVLVLWTLAVSLLSALLPMEIPTVRAVASTAAITAIAVGLMFVTRWLGPLAKALLDRLRGGPRKSDRL